MKKHTVLLAGVLLAGPFVTLGAQTAEERATYVALAVTPAGALPPMLTNTLVDRLQNGASLALRYGNLAAGDFNSRSNSIGLTAILPAGLGSSLSLTGAVKACQGCTATLMLGVGGDIRLSAMTLGNTSTSPLFSVSLDGEVGYGKSDNFSAFSGYIGAPIALVQRGEGMRFVPFITPAFVIGQTSNSGPLVSTSTSGTGLMLGGGLGIYNMVTNVTVNAGAQHSFMNGARNTIGINVIIGGK